MQISFKLGQLVLNDKMHYLKRKPILSATLIFKAQVTGLVVLDERIFLPKMSRKNLRPLVSELKLSRVLDHMICENP